MQFDEKQVLRLVPNRLTVRVDTTHDLVIEELNSFCAPFDPLLVPHENDQKQCIMIPIPLFKCFGSIEHTRELENGNICLRDKPHRHL